MTSRLKHRGPDDSDVWAREVPGGALGLGHTRLSIIDLATSRQPMTSPDGRYALVFNGEILNYEDLRDSINYPYQTSGDTEVLLAGLIRHGSAFVSQLAGQFAFAFVDTHDGSVLLARDRVGILPLFYHLTGDALVFGSEIKALLPALDKVSVDFDSLDSYLAHNSVHAPYTLYQGVRKVLPGYVLRIDRTGSCSEERYWVPPEQDARPLRSTETVTAVRKALQKAVRSALVADVPVGAYLSGGLDSSLIVALMRELAPNGAIETFSAGFGDPRFDELPYARRIAKLLGTKHHEVMVTPEDFVRLWDDLTWHRDSPLSQPADLAVFRLAELARQTVKVVLSGEGSDELFAGYRKYQFAVLSGAAARLPGGMAARSARYILARTPRHMGQGAVVLRVIDTQSRAERMDAWFAPFTRQDREILLAQTSQRTARDSWPEVERDEVRGMLLHDLQGWLPDNLLERGDRMSMAASLELRPPFLDRDLVDLAFRLDNSVKVRKGTTKWVVKEVARHYLPDEIVHRPKVGFKVPLDEWFRGGLAAMAHDLLLASDSFASLTMRRQSVLELLEGHQRGVADRQNQIWTLLSLEVWYRRFFLAPVPQESGS